MQELLINTNFLINIDSPIPNSYLPNNIGWTRQGFTWTTGQLHGYTNPTTLTQYFLGVHNTTCYLSFSIAGWAGAGVRVEIDGVPLNVSGVTTWNTSQSNLPFTVNKPGGGLVAVEFFNADYNYGYIYSVSIMGEVSTLDIITAPINQTIPVGIAYTPVYLDSYDICFHAGPPALTWTISAGALPPPMSISTQRIGGTGNYLGYISGTPNTTGLFDFTVRVYNPASLREGTLSNRFIVAGDVVINTVVSATLNKNDLVTPIQYAATGGTAPYTWDIATGALPTGLTISSSGLITGTPTVVGTYNFYIKATDAGGIIGVKSGTITIREVSVSPSLSNIIGINLAIASEQYTITGGTAPYSWDISAGELPTGLNLSSSGLLTGTPTVAGVYNYTVRVTDAVGYAYSTNTTTIEDIQLTAGFSAKLPKDVLITSIQYNASGGTAPYTWTIYSGSLPTGLNLSSSGLLTGTPTAIGTYSFTTRATDAFAYGELYSTITVQDIIVNPDNIDINNERTIGLAPIQYTATGGTAPYLWDISAGTIPPGLDFSSTGLLTGTPTTEGIYSFTVRATDAVWYKTVVSSIEIIPLVIPQITTGNQTLCQNVASTIIIEAIEGHPPYTFSLVTAGPNTTLPQGTILNSDGTITGQTAVTGIKTLNVRVTDSKSSTSTKTITLTIPQTPIITFIPPTYLIKDVYFNLPIGASTDTTSIITWQVTGLPDWLDQFTAEGSSVLVLVGTPLYYGTYPLTVRAIADGLCYSEISFSLVIQNNPVIRLCAIPFATLGESYYSNLFIDGGTPPYKLKYALSRNYLNNLPQGLLINENNLTIEGIPTVEGDYLIKFIITDANGVEGSKFCPIKVRSQYKTIYKDKLLSLPSEPVIVEDAFHQSNLADLMPRPYYEK